MIKSHTWQEHELRPQTEMPCFIFSLQDTSFEVSLLEMTAVSYVFLPERYYRVDLRTKRVDPAMPPYPRSIAKYWLGCLNTTGAEK